MLTIDCEDPYDDPLLPRPDRLEPVNIKSHDIPKPSSPLLTAGTHARQRPSSSKATQHLLVNLTNGNPPDVEAEGAAIVPLLDVLDEEEKRAISAALNLKPDPLNNSSPPLGRTKTKKDSMHVRTRHTNVLSSGGQANRESIHGLNIRHTNDKLLGPGQQDVVMERRSLNTSNARSAQPPSMTLNMGRIIPSEAQMDVGLLSSPVGTHILHNAPTREHTLRPLNSEYSPSSRGPHLSSGTTLPSIVPFIKEVDAESHAKFNRQRQRSLSIRSSDSATSPDYALSSCGSPLANLGYSPTPSQGDVMSPTEWSSRNSYSAAVSPPFNVNSAALRRSGHAITPVGEGYHTATASDHHAPSSVTASPMASTNTLITTPSDTSTLHRGLISHNVPSLRHATSTSLDSMLPPLVSPNLSQAKGSLSPMYARQIESHNAAHSDLLPPTQLSQQPANNQFKCDFSGCDAPPFSTQYLLNSHKTVHSESRPHYCSRSDCSRSVKGQGFKRKNEMIRHQLVHESPGYICPYCPSREHRYPRPDNLQRHVKAHHTEVPTGDARLRAVLDRKQTGRSTSRKKKTPQ